MKKLFPLSAFFLALVSLGGTAASAQNIKIGTVDMKRIFDSYYKTKDAESKINDARNQAKKEMEERMEIAKKSLDEVKKLDEEIAKPELSKDAKEKDTKLRAEKATDLQNMDREIREFQQNRERELANQMTRMRSGILDEINKVISDRVKVENFDLVLDKSGPSKFDVPLVLYSKDAYEFTEDVITALNKNKSSSADAAPAPAPTAKPDKKKN